MKKYNTPSCETVTITERDTILQSSIEGVGANGAAGGTFNVNDIYNREW